MILLHSFSFTNRIKQYIYTHISTIYQLSYTYICASSNNFINKTNSKSDIQVSEKQAAGITNTYFQYVYMMFDSPLDFFQSCTKIINIQGYFCMT